MAQKKAAERKAAAPQEPYVRPLDLLPRRSDSYLDDIGRGPRLPLPPPPEHFSSGGGHEIRTPRDHVLEAQGWSEPQLW